MARSKQTKKKPKIKGFVNRSRVEPKTQKKKERNIMESVIFIVGLLAATGFAVAGITASLHRTFTTLSIWILFVSLVLTSLSICLYLQNRLEKVLTESDGPDNIPTTPEEVPEITPGIDVKYDRILIERIGTVWSVDFSRDGKYFSTGSSDGKLRVWETASWKLKYELTGGHDKSVNKNVNSIAFSPDSQTLVSGGSDKTIRIWNLKDGSLARTLSAHIEKSKMGTGVTSINFSKDGTLLVSSGFDGSIFIWNILDDWKPFKITKQDNVTISALFSPDNKYIISNSNVGGIQFWSNTTIFQPSPLRTFYDQKQFTYLVFSPDGNYFAGADKDKEIRIWTTQSWDEISPLTDHENIVSSISFLTNKQLVSGGYDNKVKIWNIENGTSKKISDFGEHIRAIKVSPEGALAICGDKVVIWSKKNP